MIHDLFPLLIHDHWTGTRCKDNRFQLSAKFYGPVAQWIRHRPTEPGIAGSSPAGFIYYFNVMAFASSCVHTRVRIFVPGQHPEHNDGMKLRGILATWCTVLCVSHKGELCN